MNSQKATPTVPGTAYAGGFYAGRININGDIFAIVMAPKEPGETKMQWNGKRKAVPAAGSYFDGAANTAAMADAGSELAKWAQGLSIDGFGDWYIPSRDELELLYRYLKPTSDENFAGFRSGDNPSSAPVGYPYGEDSPAQIAEAALRDDGSDALSPAWYWSSTQHAAFSNYAWGQSFAGGDQGYDDKDSVLRARAVRRLLVIQ